MSSLVNGTFLNFFVRERLDQAQENMTQDIRVLQQSGENFNLYNLLVWTQFVINLRERSADPLCFGGPIFDEASDLPLAEAAGIYHTTYFLHLFKLILHYHLGHFQAAFAYSEKAEPMLPNFRSHYLVYLLPFYQSLAILQLSNGQGQPAKLVEKLEQNLQKFQLWAQHAPTNHQHKVDLILAEQARLAGDVATAMDHYEAAIAGARENEYIHEEALANELYGRFWVEQGKDHFAEIFLREAHALYSHWGAAAIVEHLEAQYPQWLKIKLTDNGPLRPSLDTKEFQVDLDLHTVLKASQVISGEINLDKLLGRLLTIALENSGAQRGFLILERDGQWMIEAVADLGESDPQVMQAINITENNLLSAGVVQYVANTQQTVVLGDATHNGDFAYDPYINRHQVKSLLCSPLINLGKTSGILYVENNLATDVFTPERLELLNILSSQMAISIENARTQENLEQLVVERTQTLTYTESQIRSLFETSPLGIAMTDSEGQILAANHALIRMTGYTETEIEQLNVDSLLDNPIQRAELLERLETYEVVRNYGLKLVRKDSTSLYASLNVSRLTHSAQEVFLAVIEDVSEKILIEKALNRTNKDLVNLLDSSRKMTAAMELEPLLEVLIEQLGRVVEFSGAVIWIREGDEMVIKASHFAEGFKSLLGLRFASDVLLLSEMMITREPIIVSDTSNSKELIQEIESVIKHSIQEYVPAGTSLIGLPLFAKDQVIGIIVLSYNEPGYYSHERTDLLQAFANQAAIAIENTLLHQRVQQEAILEERNRLAGELHDAVTQTLFTASVIAESLPQIWDEDEATGREYLEQLPQMLRGALAEMRTLLLELRPSDLREQTLGQLVNALIESTRTYTRAKVTLKVESDDKLPEEVTLSIYRIVQECMNNIVKHANASQISIRLCTDREGAEILISDDGRGFNPESIPPGHMGIGIMRDRAQQIGATLNIDTEPGSGTLVFINWTNQAPSISEK